jgi:hypothetical protein
MITKIKRIIISLAIAIIPLSVVPAAIAVAAPACTPKTASSGISIFPAWYDGLLDDCGNIKSPGDPSLGSDTGKRFGAWAAIIAMNIVRILLYAVGYVSLAFIIWGGFKYMTNGDNSSGTVAARKTIQNAIIGLVLSIMSVAIVSFIASRIG